MAIYQYDSYKKWVNDQIQAMPKAGRGQYRRLAEHLHTNSAIITQVFKGERELTPEQALLLADFFGLSKTEQRFLILLVNYSRAGSFNFKNILKEEIEEQRTASTKIKNRVPPSQALSEQAKLLLYSNWYYLATWSLTAIEGIDTIEAISERLHLSKKRIRDVVEFLKQHALITEVNSKLKVGPTLLHLEDESPMIAQHHQNWRLQAFKKYAEPKTYDTFYTAPVTLSESDAKILRENVLRFISESVKLVKSSPSEKLYCLCLDWFEVI